MPRPKIHDESTKMALLEAGARVLAREGPAALTTRRVADEVGASTTAVYTLFGGKGGLVREIYIEGFARLAEAFAAVERGHDPVADLRALGLAYRAHGLANPHLYELMFGRPVPEFAPATADVRDTVNSFQVLVDAVRRCIDQGRFAPADPLGIALQLWGLVHGLTSLELRGALGPPEQADEVWDAALANSSRGLAAASEEGR